MLTGRTLAAAGLSALLVAAACGSTNEEQASPIREVCSQLAVATAMNAPDVLAGAFEEALGRDQSKEELRALLETECPRQLQRAESPLFRRSSEQLPGGRGPGPAQVWGPAA